MSELACAPPPLPLRERFWSIAPPADRGPGHRTGRGYVAVVNHLLIVLDTLGCGSDAMPLIKLLEDASEAGDAAYSSPEQLRGDVIDQRSLVFSVGVLLFERLTGRHPFGAVSDDASDDDRLSRVARGELGSGINHFRSVPSGLRSLLASTLAPRAGDRLASLAELRWRLERFVADEGQQLSLPGTSIDLDKTRAIPNAAYFGRTLMAVAADLDDDPIAPPPRREDDEPMAPDATPLGAIGGPKKRTSRPTLPAPVRKFAVPALWLTAGAAVASIVLIVSRGAPAQPAAVAPETPAQATTVATKRKPRPQRSKPRPTKRAPANEPTQSNTAAPAAPGKSFQPKRGGQLAAAAAEKCLSRHRRAMGITFGIGIIFPDRGGAHRFYFSNTNDITMSERNCIQARLRGIVAGAPPKATTVVNYRVRVSAGNAVSVIRR